MRPKPPTIIAQLAGSGAGDATRKASLAATLNVAPLLLTRSAANHQPPLFDRKRSPVPTVRSLPVTLSKVAPTPAKVMPFASNTVNFSGGGDMWLAPFLSPQQPILLVKFPNGVA